MKPNELEMLQYVSVSQRLKPPLVMQSPPMRTNIGLTKPYREMLGFILQPNLQNYN